MRRIFTIAAVLLLSSVISRNLKAQWNVARFDGEKNRVYTSFGLDPAFVTTAGYGRVAEVFGHNVQLTGDIGLTAAHFDTKDFRDRLGLQTSILHAGSIHLTGSATFLTRGTENSIYRALNIGSDFTGTLGMYRHGWYAAGEFGFDKAIITHITLSGTGTTITPTRRMAGISMPAGCFTTGWWRGSTWGGWSGAKLGWRRTENWKELAVPMYGGVGVGWRW